jgi:hypothetical protein
MSKRGNRKHEKANKGCEKNLKFGFHAEASGAGFLDLVRSERPRPVQRNYFSAEWTALRPV